MSTETETVTASTVRRNPKDSIKSTWQAADKKTWSVWHWFFEILAVYPEELNVPIPVFSKTDKVPNSSAWSIHKWVLGYAAVPMLIHYAYSSYTGQNLTLGWALFLYGAWLNVTAIREIQTIRKMGQIYGYLDGDKHARDGVPDVRVREVVTSLLMTSTLRPAMAIGLAWDSSKTVDSLFGWPLAWLFIELTVYPIMVDFWFYWYHRAMHDVPWLWQFHRTHHLTKHPNTLLSLYADGWQELFDIVVIPVLAFYSCRAMGLPMGFYETWICYEYVIFVELFGHSGLRVRGAPALTAAPLLKYLKMELVIEDHDLHHRTGWKKSHNYGKQTRFWDTIFNTKTERIESREENVDYSRNASLPIF